MRSFGGAVCIYGSGVSGEELFVEWLKLTKVLVLVVKVAAMRPSLNS
jgi:hypothetical protein